MSEERFAVAEERELLQTAYAGHRAESQALQAAWQSWIRIEPVFFEPLEMGNTLADVTGKPKKAPTAPYYQPPNGSPYGAPGPRPAYAPRPGYAAAAPRPACSVNRVGFSSPCGPSYIPPAPPMPTPAFSYSAGPCGSPCGNMSAPTYVANSSCSPCGAGGFPGAGAFAAPTYLSSAPAFSPQGFSTPAMSSFAAPTYTPQFSNFTAPNFAPAFSAPTYTQALPNFSASPFMSSGAFPTQFSAPTYTASPAFSGFAAPSMGSFATPSYTGTSFAAPVTSYAPAFQTSSMGSGCGCGAGPALF